MVRVMGQVHPQPPEIDAPSVERRPGAGPERTAQPRLERRGDTRRGKAARQIRPAGGAGVLGRSGRPELAEIDTPEKRQLGGEICRLALKKKIKGRTVTIVIQKSAGRWGRIIGEVWYRERSINLEMVEEGFAWWYQAFSKNEEFGKAELAARRKKLGIWAEPKAPWDWRKKR